MKTACLDSNVLFDALSGRIDARALEQYDQLLIPVTVIGEFLCGIECNTKRGKEQRAVFESFMDEPSVKPAAITPLTAEYYAKIFSLLKAKGTPIPVNDIWIAASAMENSAELISNDLHFSYIEMLRFRHLSTSCEKTFLQTPPVNSK